MMHMMEGFGVFTLLWMTMGILFCLIVVGGVVWLIGRLLKSGQTPTMLYTPQRQDAYQPYEQGYQPPEQSPGASQEGEKEDSSPQPQYEQPQVQYPQEQEMPWHH